MAGEPLTTAPAVFPPDPSEEAVAVGPGARFDGLLSFRGTARVDGVVEGEVVADGRLVIGRGARVVARVQALEIVVGGELEGDVVAERVEVTGTGVVAGRLATLKLSVADGGVLRARCVSASELPEPEPEEVAAAEPAGSLAGLSPGD